AGADGGGGARGELLLRWNASQLCLSAGCEHWVLDRFLTFVVVACGGRAAGRGQATRRGSDCPVACGGRAAEPRAGTRRGSDCPVACGGRAAGRGQAPAGAPTAAPASRVPCA